MLQTIGEYMGLHPIKLSDDEAQALINRVFHETGYRLDRHDPVIVQYMVQKFLLKDFDEEQRRTFSQFQERMIPALKAETEKMLEQKRRLGEWSRTAAREVVQNAGEEYSRRIRETIRTTDEVMLDNLKTHITNLRSEQNDILSKLKAEHRAFVESAADFRKVITYISVGCAVVFGIGLFIAVRYLA